MGPPDPLHASLTWTTLQGLLLSRAEAEPPRGLILYPLGNTTTPCRVSYKDLHKQAKRHSSYIRSLDGFCERHPILLHFDGHWDNLLYFWATIYANAIPVLSSPFSHSSDFRHKHISGLCALLDSPLCITRTEALDLFDCPHTLRLHTVEELLRREETHSQPSSSTGDPNPNKMVTDNQYDPAFLMLTSGSTGNAKAVIITHNQVLASVASKAAVRRLPVDKPFLNWIGLDHVAGLVEIHLQALYVGVDQIHAATVDIASSGSMSFLNLLSRHRISRTFAPNSFLSRLAATMDRFHARSLQEREGITSGESVWDFSHLRILGSGGEANDIATSIAISTLLQRYGAPADVLLPGFGMTETCAGCIYNTEFPAYDQERGRVNASLGKPICGVQMRVVREDGSPVLSGEEGCLELRGSVVTPGYYRNEAASRSVLLAEGWFRTGDKAMLDENGSLDMLGRTDETVNLNGIKFPIHDCQNCVEQAVGPEITFCVAFASRPRGVSPERLIVLYVPEKWPLLPDQATWLHEQLVKAVVSFTGSRPIIVAISAVESLPRTTLGKISRAKLRIMFEKGEFSAQLLSYEALIERQNASRRQAVPPMNDSERHILNDMIEISGLTHKEILPGTSVFDMGLTSMDLIRLKRCVDRRLGINLPVIVIIQNPTSEALSKAIDNILRASKNTAFSSSLSITSQFSLPDSETGAGPFRNGMQSFPYEPVVVLREHGKKAPLWLFHPGVGEVLVFMSLAKELDDDRPIYALRARGFDPGQSHFSSIGEAVSTYTSVIQARQPTGPYALAGYSYGAMLAFEVGKRLPPGEIRFLGSFNLPPHISWRMKQLTW